MYHYFHMQFEDNPDIYIVRVRHQGSTYLAYERAARRLIESTIMNVGDYETKKVEIPESILSQLVFIEDIAQLEVVTHP